MAPLLEIRWERQKIAKQLRTYPPKIRRAFERSLDKIRRDPFQKPLKGHLKGLYSVRANRSYRIVYTYDKTSVVVRGIGDHKDVY
ncbi:hypothetical protein CDAR_302111 [Caerostris darwini]|uniref:Type II toxin-antitoxin system mRNA interferase toxin, RelE/StbE family n=1 Tax=Caerostris darwini TaxID=1538125 RepID=A0AAV4SGT2_9ARAC|nr:hypothetical protein CDAR_302111 [Caerostris darwini]